MPIKRKPNPTLTNPNPAEIPRKKQTNQYSPVGFAPSHEIKKALIEVYLGQGLTHEKISKLACVSNSTISAVKNGLTKVHKPLADRLKVIEDEKLTLGIHHILDNSITPAKLERASLQQGIVSAGILIDKRELLAGRPTSRFGMEYSDEDLAAKIKLLEDQVAEEETKTVDVAYEAED